MPSLSKDRKKEDNRFYGWMQNFRCSLFFKVDASLVESFYPVCVVWFVIVRSYVVLCVGYWTEAFHFETSGALIFVMEIFRQNRNNRIRRVEWFWKSYRLCLNLRYLFIINLKKMERSNYDDRINVHWWCWNLIRLSFEFIYLSSTPKSWSNDVVTYTFTTKGQSS